MVFNKLLNRLQISINTLFKRPATEASQWRKYNANVYLFVDTIEMCLINTLHGILDDEGFDGMIW